MDSILLDIEKKDHSFKPKIETQEDETKPKIIEDEEKIEIEKKENFKAQELGIKLERDENFKENKYTIYSDDKITAYLEKNTKVLGELIIEPIDKKKISNLDESTLAYISIFSKVFSGIYSKHFKHMELI